MASKMVEIQKCDEMTMGVPTNSQTTTSQVSTSSRSSTELHGAAGTVHFLPGVFNQVQQPHPTVVQSTTQGSNFQQFNQPTQQYHPYPHPNVQYFQPRPQHVSSIRFAYPNQQNESSSNESNDSSADVQMVYLVPGQDHRYLVGSYPSEAVNYPSTSPDQTWGNWQDSRGASYPNVWGWCSPNQGSMPPYMSYAPIPTMPQSAIVHPPLLARAPRSSMNPNIWTHSNGSLVDGILPPTVNAYTSTVDPTNMRYSKLSIYAAFSDGGLLQDAVDQILEGTLPATDFPQMRVVQHRGIWYSLDNRRLWVLKAAKITAVPALVMPLFRKLRLRLDTQQYKDTVELRWPNSMSQSAMLVNVTAPNTPQSREDQQTMMNLGEEMQRLSLNNNSRTPMVYGNVVNKRSVPSGVSPRRPQMAPASSIYSDSEDSIMNSASPILTSPRPNQEGV